jgi:hypothetical protein
VADIGESLTDGMTEDQLIELLMLRRGSGATEVELMSMRKFDAAGGDAQRRCAHRPCAQPLPVRPRANQRPTPYPWQYCSTRCRVAALRARKAMAMPGRDVTMLEYGRYRFIH